jgi:ribosomal protein S6--L-glutamate ligase
MRLCFIIEEQYRDEVMPLAVAEQLTARGHDVDVLEPSASVTCLSQLTRYGEGSHAAYVLKTVSDGPGITLLEAAAAVGIATVNNARAIRLVRDKAVAAAFARRHDIAFPVTYFVANPELLRQIDPTDYPLVVKPSNGSSCRDVFRVDTPAELDTLELGRQGDRFFLAQPYVPNTGVDIKLYNTGSDVFAVHKRSPLHASVQVTEQLVPLSPELSDLAWRVGRAFGLDIYGVDVVETETGLVALDVNDFPSFGGVPDAARLMAETIERIAALAAAERQRSYLHRMQLATPPPRAGPTAPIDAAQPAVDAERA